MKWTSRKFLMCLASFLASVATSIAGLNTDNTKVAIAGVICGIASTAIYAFCEAWVDASAAKGSYSEEVDEDGINS